MRILLDECLPRKLKRELEGYETFTVPEMGWDGVKNGALLKLAESRFDIFLTIDSNMEFQQNIPEYNLAIVALVAKGNDIDTLRPLMPLVISSIPKVEKGKVLHIEQQNELEISDKD